MYRVTKETSAVKDKATSSLSVWAVDKTKLFWSVKDATVTIPEIPVPVTISPNRIVREELPSGFQRSEYLEKSGFVDIIVERKDIREKLGMLLSILLKKNSVIKTVENETTESNTALTKAS